MADVLPGTIVDIHTHVWKTTVNGRRYFNDEALAGFAGSFPPGSSGSAAEVLASGEMLTSTLDLAEAELGRPVMACTFAIDLRPRYAMDVTISTLNDWVVEQAQIDERQRILPFACLNPILPGAAKEVARAAARGVRGYKIYPPMGFLPDDPATEDFWRAVASAQQRHGRPLPVLSHQGLGYVGSTFARPIHLQEPAVRFPDIRVIAAHVGSPWADEALWVASIHPNVYVDLAAYADNAGWWPQFHAEVVAKAKRLGVIERMVFGTDWPLSAVWLPPVADVPPWSNIHQVVGAMAAIQLPQSLVDRGLPTLEPEDFRAILGDNAVRLLDLGPSGSAATTPADQ